MANTPDETGILERRATNPLATACLILSFVALLGAIVLNIVEVGEIRATSAGRSEASAVQARDLRAFQNDVKQIADQIVSESDALKAAAGAADAGSSAGEGDSDLDLDLDAPSGDEPPVEEGEGSGGF